jgi:hypothetical protein
MDACRKRNGRLKGRARGETRIPGGETRQGRGPGRREAGREPGAAQPRSAGRRLSEAARGLGRRVHRRP